MDIGDHMDVSDPLAAIPLLAGASADELDAAIAELSRPERRPTPAHLLARAYAYGMRFERDHDPATLARALDEFQACTYTGLDRDRVARSLVLHQLQAAMLGQPVDPARMRSMVDAAGEDPSLPGVRDVLHALVDVAGALVEDPAYDRASALRRLDRLEATVSPDSAYGRLVPSLRMALQVKRGQDAGNYDDGRRAGEHARAMLAGGLLDPRQQLVSEVMVAASDGMAAAQRGDMVAADVAMQRMTALVEQLPPDDPATAAMRNLLAGAGGWSGAPAAGADTGSLSAGERAFRLFTSGMSVCRPAIDRQDAAALARGVGTLREAADTAPADDPRRVMYLSTLGRLLCALFQLGADRPALDEALRRLDDARRAAAHPGHPLWALTAMGLGFAYRLAGRRIDGRAWGQRALRGHGWSVLLQAGTADAAAAARHAVDDAVEVARWCVADGDHAGAAAAVDSGRCLMLYAATVVVDIPARLRARGHDDLVARWAREPDDADLRLEVLTALTGVSITGESVADVLDPPPLEAVRAALADGGFDALVYLIPGDAGAAGGAVLVPRGGPPYHLTLPGLVSTAGGVVERHSRSLADRDADVVDGPDAAPGADVRWRQTLDRLCVWAWTAAMGPLLFEIQRWRLGRRPRLVLVPVGDLATVPWHAALDDAGNYVVQRAVLSYTPSARLLCQNLRRPAVPAGSGGLVVGDPTRDLPDARAEALAVRSTFYPDAVFLGDDRSGFFGDGRSDVHPDDGGQGNGATAAATPAAVLDWLRQSDGHRSVLHLACHGTVQRGGVDGSYLLLAGGERMSARDIVETRGGGPVGLVALAACTTGVPSGAYDEAFSLSTAFLAAGAQTVFGSLWPVPSDTTSLLMFMAHHFLRSVGLRPAEALNRAQLWMLDPEREVPPTMPFSLARRVPALDGRDVAGWAGFTHLGR